MRFVPLDGVDGFVGRVGGHNAEMTHLEKFLERTTDAVVVFNEQYERQRAWHYPTVSARGGRNVRIVRSAFAQRPGSSVVEQCTFNARAAGSIPAPVIS